MQRSGPIKRMVPWITSGRIVVRNTSIGMNWMSNMNKETSLQDIQYFIEQEKLKITLSNRKVILEELDRFFLDFKGTVENYEAKMDSLKSWLVKKSNSNKILLKQIDDLDDEIDELLTPLNYRTFKDLVHKATSEGLCGIVRG
jgi:hypothetical protein